MGGERRREGEAQDLSDSMPVNNNSLGVEFVSEINNHRVSSFGSDGRPWKLAIDPHHNIFDAIR